MKIGNRKLSAVFLAAIMLLQFVFTIPMDVFADTSKEQRGTVIEAVTLVRESVEKAERAEAGEKLVLQIEWSHGSSGENPVEETVIRLPEEFFPETDEKEILDDKGVLAGTVEVKENEIILSMNQNEVQLQGILEIPVQIGALEVEIHTLEFFAQDEYVNVEIVKRELVENQLFEEEVGMKGELNVVIEEEHSVSGSLEAENQETSGDKLELNASSEINTDQFIFNNIYFLDKNYDPELHDLEDFIYSIDRPFDINVVNNYGFLYFDFSLIDGHNVKAGDTFTFNLPEELKPVSGISGELGSIGKWFVQMDGTVRFEFSDGVNGDEVGGFFWFSVYLDESKIDESIIQEIQFEINPDFDMRFAVKPKNGALLNKKGTINNNGYNSSEAYWIVDINTSLDKLINASVSDVIPKNMILKEGSIEVYSLDVTSGGVKTESDLLDSDKYVLSIDEKGNPKVSFIGLTDEEASKAYRIKYTTEIIEPAEGFDGTQTFKNNVVLINNEENYTSASTVSSGYGKAIDKLSPSYDRVKQEFDWTINYNFNEKFIDSDFAYVTDTWTPNGVMELISGEFKIYPVIMDNSGNANVSDVAIDSSMYTLVENGSAGFTLTFKEDIDRQAYQIRYKTKILGTQGTGIVDKSGSVSNKVVTGTDKTDGSSGSWSQRGVIKSSTGTDVREKEIDWRILLNQNGYLMENLVVTDTFIGDGLTLLADTLKITGKDRTYVSGTDYTLDYTEPVFGVSSGGFVITFNAPVNDPLTLTYTTHFERNSNGSASYGNKAKVDWEEGEIRYSSETGVITVTPAGYTGPNGVKNGYYDAKTKEITWSIHTNYARLPIENGYKISDVIPEHQEMVEGSLEVFSYSVDNKGTITGETFLNLDSYKVVYPEENGENKLEVELLEPHIGTKKSIGIRFRTEFIGEWIRDPKVKNIAEFTNGGDTFTLEATVTIPNGGEYIHKTGIQTGIYNERVDWTVYINRSQSLIKGYTLTDNPDLNSILLEDTFVLYRTVVSVNGNVIKADEILEEGKDYDLLINTDNETGKQNFILKFTDDIKDAYILEYSSYIDPLVGKGEAISNAYTAEGTTTEVITDGDVSNEVRNVNSGGAGGSSVRGGLVIRKIDDKNPERVLEGALFNLYTKDGAQLLRTGTTDAEGLVRFGGLRRGEYLLKEIESPEGYVISKDLAEGVIVTLNHDNDGEFKLFTYKNALTKMNLRKVDGNNNVISDEAIFDLYRGDGTLVNQNLKTSNGLLTIEDLEEGNYYLKETKAPTGYILNPSKIEFTISINANGTQDIPTVDIANYKGQAEFVKVNEQGNPLGGAVFHLYRGLERIGTDLVSDSNGKVKINDLAPGTYQVREAKAPAGYLLNTEEIQFTIPQSAEGKPDVFILGQFRNYQGMVRLVKADEQGNPLEGAEFKIIDNQNRDVKTGLTTGEDGRLYASGLAPGRYSFIETKAPAGYILEPTPIGFVIIGSAEGVPVVVSAGHKENYKGSVLLEKTDEAGAALSGAVFELFEVLSKEVIDRILIGTYTSDAKGQISVEKLAPGEYEFVEKTAPEGYLVNSNAILFTVDSETVGRPERVNAGTAVNYKGSAGLVKIDSDGNPLSGAKFELLSPMGETLRTDLISDEDGKVTVENLAPGLYSFKEVEAPAGFILNDASMEFEIEKESEGKPVLVEAGYFINFKGSVELIKTDKDENPLQNALFTLYDENGVVIMENLKSDEDGRIHVDELSPGKYYFQEEIAPVGFIRNTEKIHFTIAENDNGKPELITVEAINYKGSVKLMKLDQLGDILAGAKFELRNEETDQIIEESLTTDENGVILVTDLAPGEYTFLEVSAPEGYITNLEPLSFTVGKEYEGVPEIIMAGEITNYKGSALIVKTDEEGNPLEGALFNVLDEEGNLVRSELRSDADGKIFAEELSPGKYHFVETKSPQGYLLNIEMKAFEIAGEVYGEPVTVDAGTLINYKGKAILIKTDESGTVLKDAVFNVTDEKGALVLENLYSDENGVVTAEGLAPGSYYFEEIKAPEGFIRNELKIAFRIMDENEGEPVIVEAGSLKNYKGSAMWYKVNTKGEGLEGARFDVLDEEGNTVYENLSSDEDGKVMIEELTPGQYTIVETSAPEGYIRNLDTLTFTIASVSNEKPEMVIAENYVNYQGSVILTKTDDMDRPLEGAAFELWLDGKMMSLWTTDEDGKIFIENLQPGKYSLVEVESPEGYILDQTSYDFVVSDEGHGEPMTIQAGHAKNHKGTMVLKKVDENGQQLEGAIFEIRDVEGNLISRIESDGKGLAKASDLAPGNYTVREVKAPKGYIRNTDTLTFTIEELSMGKPEEIDLGRFVNYSGTLEVKKVDSQGNPLKNAEFEILDADGNTYREKLISDDNGKIVISGIAPGRYALVEVKAPEGYVDNDQKYDFTIIESHEGEPLEIVITVVNVKMPEKDSTVSLPKAGTKEPGFYFTLLGILFIAAGFVYLNKQKKRA